MSKSRRTLPQNKTAPSSTAAAAQGDDWADMLSRMGNSFMSHLTGSDQQAAGPSQASATEQEDLSGVPMVPEWLQGKIANVRGASVGGTVVEAYGAQLETLDPADVAAEYWTADIDGELEGKVWDKMGGAGAKVHFDETPDQVMGAAKRSGKSIDLFANFSGGLQ